MTDFSSLAIRLAVQIGAVAIVALLLDRRLARRCPASAPRILLAALGSMSVLTALAFVPLPDWWTWERGRPMATRVTSETSHTDGAIDLSEADTSPGVLPLEWLATLRAAPGVSHSPRLGTTLIVAWTLGIVTCGALLAVGLVGIERLQRRGVPVEDSEVVGLATTLSQRMGIRRHVTLREVNSPGLPATAGWRRPVILLPLDWREWSVGELRATIAHELAHIQSHDFLAIILARLITSLHFYHPLAWRLVARLRLRMEIAADALAAQHVGGRAKYLRALAELALRGDGVGSGGPAPLLMSAHGGVLVRRIQMLRNTEEVRPLARSARGLVMAMLVGFALLASGLRGPAQVPFATPTTETTKFEPFDLSYVPATENGTHAIVAFRPSVLLAQPGMDRYANELRAGVIALLKEQGRSLPDRLTLADVDQVVADMSLQVQVTGQKGSRSLQAGSGHLMVRMKNDVDWPAVLKSLFGDVEVCRQDQHTIYLVKHPTVGAVPIPLYAVDARTIVMVRKDNNRFVIPSRKVRDMGPGWKQVERCAIAQVLDNRAGYWTKTLGPEVKEHAGSCEFLKSAETICLGVNFESGMHGTMIVSARDEAGARECQQALGLLGKTLTGQLAEAMTTESKDGAIPLKLGNELLKSVKTKCEGAIITLEGHCSVKLAELLSVTTAKATVKDEK